MTEETPLEEPFENMSKEDMDYHLRTMHGINPGSYLHNRTKWTKDEASSWHRRDHELMDAPRPEGVSYEIRHQQANWDNRRERYQPHVHKEITVETITGESNLVEALKKPLTLSERRGLLDLVDNDFSKLRREMEVYGNDQLQHKLRRVNDSWDRKKDHSDEFAVKGRALQREYNEALEKLHAKFRKDQEAMRDKAAKAGVSLDFLGGSRGTQDVRVNSQRGRTDDLKKAQEEHKREMDTAQLQLEHERLAARRQILLAAVPKESLQLLDKLPTAKQLMTAAVQARQDAAKQIAG